VTQDGLYPLGQVLRCVIVGTVTDLPAQVGLRFLEMPLGLPDRRQIQSRDLLEVGDLGSGALAAVRAPATRSSVGACRLDGSGESVMTVRS